MPAYDTVHLLELLRQHTGIPAVAGYDDEACLRALTATLHGYVWPLVKADWQEHNLSGEAATYTVALTGGRREYPLPARAAGAGVRKAVLAGPSGARRPLRLFEVDSLEEVSTAGTGLPEGYVVRGGRLYLHPAPAATSSGWSLRLALSIRPARLALPSSCGAVSALQPDSGSNAVVTLSSAVLGTSGSVVVDLVRGVPPFEALALEVSASLTGAGLTASIPRALLPVEGLLVGDYLCPPDTAPFAQCPVELLPVLTQRTSTEQLTQTGDTDLAAAKAAPLQEMRRDGVKTVTPRTGEARLQGNGMRKWRGGGGGGSGWPSW